MGIFLFIIGLFRSCQMWQPLLILYTPKQNCAFNIFFQRGTIKSTSCSELQGSTIEVRWSIKHTKKEKMNESIQAISETISASEVFRLLLNAGLFRGYTLSQILAKFSKRKSLPWKIAISTILFFKNFLKYILFPLHYLRLFEARESVHLLLAWYL